MNPEVESTQTKITQSGTKHLVQDIFRAHSSQQPGKNTRDVEHDYEPPRLSPADAALESGVIR